MGARKKDGFDGEACVLRSAMNENPQKYTQIKVCMPMVTRRTRGEHIHKLSRVYFVIVVMT